LAESPVQYGWTPGTLVTCQPPVQPNFDDRLSLLHRISECGLHAANQNIGKSSLTAVRLLRDKCAAFCQHDSNARESQGGAELIGISVAMLTMLPFRIFAPGSCFQSWSQTIRMI